MKRIISWAKAIMLLGIMGAGVMACGEEIIFESHFNSPESVKCWGDKNGVSFVADGGINKTGCIKFSSDKVADTMISIPFDLEKVRGRAIQIEGMLKGENLAIPSPKYLGPKMLLNIQAAGENSFAEQNKLFGTHDWKKFKVFAQVPDDVKKITLSLGIQHSSGTLYADDVKVILVPKIEQKNFILPTAPLQKNSQYRGVMSGYNLQESDLKDLAEQFGGNLIRWQFLRGRSDIRTPEKYMNWLDEQIVKLDAAMPALKKYNIKVVIDLHAGPGMEQNALLSNAICWDIPSQDLLVKVWEKIALHYRGNDRIYGYDLLNEPREDDYVYEPDGGLDWNRLAARLARNIRVIDPTTPIIIEPAKWGGPAGFKIFQPINLPNIIYSVHFYSPHKFTHQGVGGNLIGAKYPGIIDGDEWNRAKLREKLQPVIDFQRKYNVPIYVGEFSAVRWAPGGAQYLEDCISIFEENGWDWTYHAFREWSGWSVEHSDDPKDNAVVTTDTDRKKTLLKWFDKNNKK